MAIIFVPPKRDQRILFWSISTLVILILAIVFLAAFPLESNKQTNVYPKDVTMPDIKVNFDILNSSQLENLEPFLVIEPSDGDIGRKEPFLPY